MLCCVRDVMWRRDQTGVSWDESYQGRYARPHAASPLADTNIGLIVVLTRAGERKGHTEHLQDVVLCNGSNAGCGSVIKSLGFCGASLHGGDCRVPSCFPGVKIIMCLSLPLLWRTAV